MADVLDYPARSYGGVEAHARAAQRRELLLDAVLNLIDEQGVLGVTVRTVSRRAGVSSRYLYESFESCEHLVLSCYDRHTELLFVRLAQAAADTPDDAASRIRAHVNAAIEFFTEDARRGRLVVEMDNTLALRERRRSMVQTIVSTMVERAEPLMTTQQMPRQTLILKARLLAAGCLDLAAAWVSGYADATPEQLSDVMTDMLLSSLQPTGQA